MTPLQKILAAYGVTPERTVAAVFNRQANSNEGAGRLQSAATFRVTKMKFVKPKDPETGKCIRDETTVIYIDFITLNNIPIAAYDCIVNGKPALEGGMERQAVTKFFFEN